MKKLTSNEFIEKAKLIHGDKYDYSKIKYTNNKTKIQIICPEHGIFEQTPVNHINNKQNCPKCAEQVIVTHNESQKLNSNDFIRKAILVHGTKYDYSFVNYINKKTKIKIICSNHGVFEQKPQYHLKGCGCPICNESKGEKIIKEFLKENNIVFNCQHIFDSCKNINKLPFDFYLPNHNICIEYDGEQHFKPISVFGGKKRFEKQQFTDKIKNDYCMNSHIKLIRISYNEKIIQKLKNELYYVISSLY